MNAYTSIVGNRALCSRLSKAISDNSLSHAYIIEGSAGSGRHTLALQTIAALSCSERGKNGATLPCGRCISCRKILEDNSPDVIHIVPEEGRVTLGVDAARFLKSNIYLPPTDLDIKAYIIDSADIMTQQAQNALLLSLEEPPEYIMYFLICENSSSLLETVKSRAPILRMEKIAPRDIAEYLLKNNSRARQLKETSPEEFDELVCAADGSIGEALSLLDLRKRKSVFENRRIAKDFIGLASGKLGRDKLELVMSLGTKRQDVCERLSYIQYALRDLIALKRSDDAPLCFYADRDSAAELSTHFTSGKLLTLYEATETAADDLSRNTNVKLTLINMLKNSELI